MALPFSLPICSILARPLNHINELMRNRLIRLLTRMQLIIPKEMAQPNFTLTCAIVSRRNITEIILTRHVPRCIQISSWVVDDVGHKGVDVENSDRGSRIPFCNEKLEGSAVREDVVNGLGVLFHFAANFGDVCWLLLSSVFTCKIEKAWKYLVWPVMTRLQSSLTRHSIQRRQLQGSCIHQHKVPSTSLVNLVKSIKYAINIIRNSRPIQAAIRQEGIGSEIVGTNPHRIDGVIGFTIRVERIGKCGGIDVLGVCDESVDFINDVREGAVDGGKIAVDHLVRTNRSADCIVVELCTGIYRHPSVPGYTSAWRVGALRE